MRKSTSSLNLNVLSGRIAPPRRHRRARTPLGARTRPRLESLEGRVLLRAGELDPTFGVGGLVISDILLGSAKDRAADLAITQPDGKLLVVGTTLSDSSQLVVARYNTDGRLDADFGTGGK